MVATSFLFITVIALVVSYWKDRVRTKNALRAGLRSLIALIPPVLGMTALVGLVLALTPPEQVSRLFELHGAAGFALVSLVGAVVTMPAPVAFPT